MDDVSEHSGNVNTPAQITNVTTVVIFVTTFLLIYYNTRRKSGDAPGPPLLPVVGNLFSLGGKDVLKTLHELRLKYGDIYALYIGTELTVFLNGHEVLNEALVKKGSLFVRRPYSSYHKLVVRNPGITYLNDKSWRGQRNLVMKAFNSLFFKNGGIHLKNIISNEADKLVKRIGSCSRLNDPFEIEGTLLVTVANVVSDLLFKRSFDFEDNEFIEALKKVSKLATEVGKMQVLCNCFPFLAKLPGDLLRADYTNRTYFSITNYLTPYIEACKDDPNTFVGLYCQEMERIYAETGRRSPDEKFLTPTTYEILGAGSETTASTLQWILLFLMNHPEKQETMYNEVSNVVSKDGIMSADLAKQCPYSTAVIYECQRLTSSVPLGLPRTVPYDLEFRGYTIPENCTVITNLNSTLMDPEVWDEPEVFKPERFLNQSKTEISVQKPFVPFSLGPRSCVGESLARMELFVFLTTMVANFEFLPYENGCRYDMDGLLGLTWHPKPFKLRAKRR